MATDIMAVRWWHRSLNFIFLVITAGGTTGMVIVIADMKAAGRHIPAAVDTQVVPLTAAVADMAESGNPTT